jgi:flagellar biogenesis protein FliO
VFLGQAFRNVTQFTQARMPTRRRILTCCTLAATLACSGALGADGASPRERPSRWSNASAGESQTADAEAIRRDKPDEVVDLGRSFVDRPRSSKVEQRESDEASSRRDSRRSRERDIGNVQPANYVDEPASSANERKRANDSAANSAVADGELPPPIANARSKSLPLATKRLPALGSSGKNDQPGGWSALLSVGGSLTVVLGLFLAVVWFLRRTGSKSSAILPSEVFEVLGRAPLAGRQTAQLVRCGAKLLLISVTPGGSETLTEITDAVEVDRLAGLCQQTRGASASATFRNLFSQFAGEPTEAATKSVPPARGLLARRESRLAPADKLIDDFAADRALSSSRREVRDA